MDNHPKHASPEVRHKARPIITRERNALVRQHSNTFLMSSLHAVRTMYKHFPTLNMNIFGHSFRHKELKRKMATCN